MNWIKDTHGRVDPFKAAGYLLVIILTVLISSLCWTLTEVSRVSHENELLVAQKGILKEANKHVHCDNLRFKYDPITGSIYDNDTKDIYRKVRDPDPKIMYRVTYNGEVKGESEIPFDESIYIEGYQVDFFYGEEVR